MSYFLSDLLSQDEQGGTKLYWAARNNRIAEFEQLIKSGKEMGVLKTLIEKKHDIGNTPLKTASSKGNIEIVKILLQHKASIDEANNRGFTPLMSAAEGGHLDVVMLLLEHNANLQLTTNDGATALYIAIQYGQKDVVETLVSSGDKINKLDFKNYTALHCAARNGKHEIVEWMLEKPTTKCIINDKSNEYRDTPLIVAIQYKGDLAMVKLLVSGGADAGIKGAGKTPLETAKKKRKNDIVEYLESL